MTLMVCSYTRDPETNEISWVDVDDPGAELGGFESCRHDLWGSGTARKLGMTLLPLLSDQDVWEEGEDLLLLEQEALTILHRIRLFVVETGYDADFIAHRTGNILSAIARVRSLPNGGVHIG